MFKKFSITILFCLCALHCFAEIKLPVFESFEAAKKQSVDENKLLIIYFTGSTWCPPCKFLDSQILHTEKFAKFANENLVIAVIDFLDFTTPASKKFFNNHKKLAEQFRIDSFPTMIFINPKTNKVERMEGLTRNMSVESFINDITSIKEKLAK